MRNKYQVYFETSRGELHEKIISANSFRVYAGMVTFYVEVTKETDTESETTHLPIFVVTNDHLLTLELLEDLED